MRDLIPLLLFRQARAFPARRLWTILGIGLATALVVSVRLANRAALDSFRDSSEKAAGRSSLSLVADGPAFDEKLLSDLSWTRGWGEMLPVVEGRISQASNPSEPLVLLGLDLLKDRVARDFEIRLPGNRSPSREEWLLGLARPDAVFLAARYARERGLEAGKDAVFTVNGLSVTLRVQGHFSDRGAGSAYGGRMAVMDIAAAQALLGLNGRLSRLEWVLSPGSDPGTLAARITKEVPPGLRVEKPETRVHQAERMSLAFRSHLTALSLASLLVGAFLLYTTISFSTLRQASELRVLRTLGMSRSALGGWVMADAAILVFAGVFLGLGVGRVAAVTVVKMWGGTWSRFCLSVPITATLPSHPGEWIWALGAFLFVTLWAVPAAWQAFRTRPGWTVQSEKKEGASTGVRGLRVMGAALALVLAAFFCRVPPWRGLPWGGYAAVFCLLSAFVALTPYLLSGFQRLTGSWIERILPVGAVLASRHLRSGLDRSSLGVSALSVGVALMVSAAILAGSLRNTVRDWAAETYRADLYVQAGAFPGGLDAVLPPSLAEAVRILPGVAAVEGTRSFSARAGEETIRVSARDVKIAAEYDRLPFLDGVNAASALPRLAGRLSAVVSEPLAWKFRLRPGDSFTLKTPVGSVPFEIMGVYQDFTDERGTLLMDRGTHLSLFGDSSINRLGVYLEPGQSRDALRKAVQSAGGSAGDFRVLTQDDLRQEALRTFAWTRLLALLMAFIAVAAAVLAILTALTFLLLERAPETGILRYLGAARSQVRNVVLWEAGFLACAGCALGCLMGWVLSWVWVGVLCPQTFGWIPRYAPPWGWIGVALAGVGFTAFWAGCFPARAASNSQSLRILNRE